MSTLRLIEAALAIVELSNAQAETGDDHVSLGFKGNYMKELRAGLFEALKPAVQQIERGHNEQV